MKFMITFCHVDGAWDALGAEQQKEHYTWLSDFAAALKREKNSQMVFFQPGQMKRVVQDADGNKTVLNGPADASAEEVGGYFILEAATMEEAVSWADRGRFMIGTNEVRQIVDSTID